MAGRLAAASTWWNNSDQFGSSWLFGTRELREVKPGCWLVPEVVLKVVTGEWPDAGREGAPLLCSVQTLEARGSSGTAEGTANLIVV